MGRSKAVYDKFYIEKLIDHWCKVNNKTIQDFYQYEALVYKMSKRRFGKTYVIKVGRRTLC